MLHIDLQRWNLWIKVIMKGEKYVADRFPDMKNRRDIAMEAYLLLFFIFYFILSRKVLQNKKLLLISIPIFMPNR